MKDKIVQFNCSLFTRAQNSYTEEFFRTRLNMSVNSRSNWNSKVLDLDERGKPEYPPKTNFSERGRQPGINSTRIWRRRRDLTTSTLAGEECCHHCSILALFPVSWVNKLQLHVLHVAANISVH